MGNSTDVDVFAGNISIEHKYECARQLFCHDSEIAGGFVEQR